MTTRYILARSGSGMLLVTLEKIGTSPIGSTMMNSATVARTKSTVGSGFIYSHLFLWWAGRDLNPRPSPCEGDVRSVHIMHTRLDYRPGNREGRIEYFIFQEPGGLCLEILMGPRVGEIRGTFPRIRSRRRSHCLFQFAFSGSSLLLWFPGLVPEYRRRGPTRFRV